MQKYTRIGLAIVVAAIGAPVPFILAVIITEQLMKSDSKAASAILGAAALCSQGLGVLIVAPSYLLLEKHKAFNWKTAAVPSFIVGSLVPIVLLVIFSGKTLTTAPLFNVFLMLICGAIEIPMGLIAWRAYVKNEPTQS